MDNLVSALDDTDAQASRVWPELEALAQPARERRRLPPETRSRIIIELCALAALSVKELALLLDRSEAYVGDAIRPLVNSGRLTFLYPDQPRHPKQKYLTGKTAAAANGHGRYSPPQLRRIVPAEAPLSTKSPAPPATEATASPAPVALAPAPAGRGESRLTSQLANILAVAITGILLATLRPSLWALYALLIALALALTHLLSRSPQYQQFRALPAAGRKRALTFLLLKAGVAFGEIALVYMLAGLLIPQA
ncbi:MAG: hypothetical protein ACT443_13395 [Gemmatimonadota bacterium]